MRTFLILVLFTHVLWAQVVNQVNKQNKTIAVSAEASVEEQPEIAFLKVGFKAEGPATRPSDIGCDVWQCASAEGPPRRENRQIRH